MALCFVLSAGRSSPTDFAAVAAAALGVPFALDQEGPDSSKDAASPDFVVVQYSVVPVGRASPADSVAAVAAVLVVPVAPAAVPGVSVWAQRAPTVVCEAAWFA